MRLLQLWLLPAFVCLLCTSLVAGVTPTPGSTAAVILSSPKETTLNEFRNLLKNSTTCEATYEIKDKLCTLLKGLKLNLRTQREAKSSLRDTQLLSESLKVKVNQFSKKQQNVIEDVRTEVKETMRFVSEGNEKQEEKVEKMQEDVDHMSVKVEKVQDGVNNVNAKVEKVQKDVNTMIIKLDTIMSILIEKTPQPNPGFVTVPVTKSPAKFTPKDCQELYNDGQTSDGIYSIRPVEDVLQVVCSQGYTTIQRREDGQLNFDRELSEYAAGFGSVEADHWIGLDNMHYLTTGRSCRLRILLLLDAEDSAYWFQYYPKDADNKTKYVAADHFAVGSGDRYTLTIEHMTSNLQGSRYALQMEADQNGRHFSTKDMDRDTSTDNCARNLRGGWWYRSCGMIVLNKGTHRDRECSADNHVCAWMHPYYPRRTEMQLQC